MEPATPAASSSQDWLTRLSPGIFLLLWSAGFPITKLGLQYASPVTFLAIRFALSFGVLLAFFVVLKPALPRSAQAWGHLLVVGFLIQVMYFGLSYVALKAGVSAGVLALIVSLQPILVGLLAPKLVGERIGKRQWLGLILGLLGATGVIGTRSHMEVESASALLLAVGALLGITAAMLYEKRFGVAQHPVTANLVQYGVGLACFAPLAFFFEDAHVQWSATFVASMAYLVIGNSLIAVSLLLAMTRAGQVSRVASLFFFVPPAAAVLSYLMLGEAMPPAAWWAMSVAIIGVAIATTGKRRL
jgi:drug/metabolite transporter (DMT)-like permease